MIMTLNYAAKQRLIDCLYSAAKFTVQALNDSVGRDVLYMTVCADLWSLYGRKDSKSPDLLLSWGLWMWTVLSI